jgi:hypothetical protein
MSADATLPHHPEGLGAKNVMLCLRDAGLQTTDVDGVNMHGTSTHLVIWQNQSNFMFWRTCLHYELKFNKINDWSLTWCCRSC